MKRTNLTRRRRWKGKSNFWAKGVSPLITLSLYRYATEMVYLHTHNYNINTCHIKKSTYYCLNSLLTKTRRAVCLHFTGSIFPSASSYWTNPGANLYSNIAAASASHSMGHHHHHPGASTGVGHHAGVSPHLANYSHYASPWPSDVHWAARSLPGTTAARPPPHPYKPIEWTPP